MDDIYVLYRNAPYSQDTRRLVRTDDGEIIGVTMQDLLAATPHVQDILANKTGVEPLKWGEINTFTTWNFQASGIYEQLTEATFVANIWMGPPDNKDTVTYIEYRLSQILPGLLCED
jgi:hypothetical protein